MRPLFRVAWIPQHHLYSQGRSYDGLLLVRETEKMLSLEKMNEVELQELGEGSIVDSWWKGGSCIGRDVCSIQR